MSTADVDASLSNSNSHISSSQNVPAPSTSSPVSNPNPNPHPSTPTPSSDDLDDLLLDCRYGERYPVSQFVETYGVTALANARDERGNNVLHMCAANGHDDILTYILSLPSLPPTLITSGNDAGSTPLHWACLNAQLACAKRLVAFRLSSCLSPISDPDSAPPNFDSKSKSEGQQERDNDTVQKLGLGPALIFARNTAGHTPLGEAERAGWDEGARWLVSVMDLQLEPSSVSVNAEEADTSQGDEADTNVEAKRTGEGKRDGGGKDGDGDDEVEVELARLRVSDGDLSIP